MSNKQLIGGFSTAYLTAHPPGDHEHIPTGSLKSYIKNEINKVLPDLVDALELRIKVWRNV